MNESGALVNGYDEKQKSKPEENKELGLDIVADIGEGITGIVGVITSLLD